MIVQCEKCLTKYNLDETLLEEGGSKVRCSRCKHTFLAYPEGPDFTHQEETGFSLEEEFEETVALDSPPILKEEPPEFGPDEKEIDFDKVFDESLEDQEPSKSVFHEGVLEPEEKERAFDEEALDEASMKESFSSMEAEEEEESQEIPPTKHARRSRILVAGLVAILLLLGAAAAIIFYAPELLPDSLRMFKPAKKAEVADIGVRRLSFKDVTGSFINSKMAGNLFVIRGLVVNDYPKSRSYILVRGSILDDKGQSIMKKVAYAGNTFTEEEIQRLPLEELNKAMKNRDGINNKDVNVPPDTPVPFMILFENLPQNLSEFTVEAVSSSPGA